MARISTVQDLPVWIDPEELKMSNKEFTRIKETLTTPDEVYWSDSETVPYMTYLRFYKDGAMKVTSRSVKVSSFEHITDVDSVRKGLLIIHQRNILIILVSCTKAIPQNGKRAFQRSKRRLSGDE